MKIERRPSELPAVEPEASPSVSRAPAANAPRAQKLEAPEGPERSVRAEQLVGAHEVHAKAAPHPHAATSAIDVRTAKARFSMPPGELSKLLAAEVTSALDFAASVSSAFTFFGGARIKEDDPYFARGRAWGETILLLNAEAKKPGLIDIAAKSGLFAPAAVDAARAAVLGVMAGTFGPAHVGQAIEAHGGIDAESLAVAAADLALRERSPEATQLLLVLTRTGAGPGMMEAVPLGYVEARAKVAALAPELVHHLDELVTQGSRIQLPFEQATSPWVERIRAFAHFLPRRLALTERAAGFVVFPGGFGTLNELFEVWREGRASVLDARGFWGGFADTLKAQWAKRGLVSEEDRDKLVVVDSIPDGLGHLLANAPKEPSSAEALTARATQMVRELEQGLDVLDDLPPAVSVLGGRKLDPTAAELDVVRSIAERLARSQIPLRIGGPGALFDAVYDGAKRGDPNAPLQAFVLTEGDGARERAALGKVEVAQVLESAPVHKILMYENTEAFVALPGGIGTLDEVFEVACLMQTGKLPRRPLILVGKEFWQPILDEIERVMTSGERKTIGPDDMKLFTVTDDPVEAARLVRRAHAR
ncbi:LOG family protein [Myxococcota bacterium]|nr:LOG family protein [Myxococcota bacterium]